MSDRPNLPDPPDLEADEDRIAELAALIPEPEPAFRDEMKERLDQRSLGRNVVTLGWWGAALALLQLFTAVLSLVGVDDDRDQPREE